MHKTDAGDYATATKNAGFVRLPNHCVIEVTGEDRNVFLNNYCTADLKKLPANGVTEAFILNEKGKCLLFATVVSLENRLLLVFHDPSVVADIIAHLDKYLIREDAELVDRSLDLAVWFCVGEKLDQALAEASIVAEDSTVVENSASVASVFAKSELAGDGWLVVGKATNQESIESMLRGSGIEPIGIETANTLRVENVTPWNGIESSVENLPQELDRDEKSISFTKGCYLGQETVARLDALGRVNWLLRGLRTDSNEVPDCPFAIEQDGKKIARITAVAWSPVENCWLAIGFVKRGFEKTDSVVGDWSVRKTV